MIVLPEEGNAGDLFERITSSSQGDADIHCSELAELLATFEWTRCA
jgi:hypothetical protein